MGTMKAVITNPLKPRPKFKAATQKVQRLNQRYTQAKRSGDAEKAANVKARLGQARRTRRGIKNKWEDKRANQVEFDTRWMWDKVKDILSADHSYNLATDLLHQSNSQLNTLLDGTNQIAEFAANNQALLQADAMRMSMLLGAPLPEKAADHVLIGDRREDVDPKSRGRRSLRIEPATTTPSLAI